MSTASEKGQALEKRLEQLRRSQELADVRDVMATPQGRRLMYRIVYEVCHIEALSYSGTSDTNVREGERNVGLTIKNELMDQHPDMYLQMILEMLTARREDLLKRKAARDSPETPE